MPNKTPQELSTGTTTDFGDLAALTINCTLKKSPEGSHTDKLLGLVDAIMVKNDVALNQVRLTARNPAQCHFHDLEPDAYGPHAQRRRRYSTPRKLGRFME